MVFAMKMISLNAIVPWTPSYDMLIDNIVSRKNSIFQVKKDNFSPLSFDSKATRVIPLVNLVSCIPYMQKPAAY